MLINWKWASVFALASVMSGCGGGGDATARGAIAYGSTSRDGAIAVNFTSQQDANTEALAKCGSSDCAVVVEFSGNGTCGSVAVASNGAWGAASGGSKEVADTRAVGDCQKRGGTNCSIPNWLETQCN